MKIAMYILAIFIVVLYVCVFVYSFTHTIPEDRFNFIGMTRMEVIKWADKHGRLTHINKRNPYWNKIKGAGIDN